MQVGAGSANAVARGEPGTHLVVHVGAEHERPYRSTERDEVDVRLSVDIDYPLKEGEDPDDLAQAGWAVVFPFVRKGSEAASHQAAIREALIDSGLPIIPAEKVAGGVVALFEGEMSGEAWFVQPGWEPQNFKFRGIPGPRDE